MGRRRFQVSVVGFNEDSCTPRARDAAYRVGKAIAERGGVLITGGLGGVMEAACMGARKSGGKTVGIIPSEDSKDANKYCEVVVATGIGKARNLVVAYSGDAMIVVGGGAGTLIEVAAAYQAGKRIVAVAGTGGIADSWAGRYLDERRTALVVKGHDAEDAVEKAMRGLKRGRRARESGIISQ